MSRNSITPFARLAHHRRIGVDYRRRAVRAGTQVLDRHGAGGVRLRRAALHLDQAHAAIAGDRQALVVAEARHFGARGSRTPAAACMPAGTSTSMPSTMSLGHASYSAAIARTGSARADCAVYWSMRSSISGGNGGSGPGPARPPHRPARRSCGPRSASSPRAACRSRASRRGPRPCASSRATSSPCLRGRACTGRSSRACRNRRAARSPGSMSVDLSMTITAAVPRPELQLAEAVEIHRHVSMICSAGTHAHRRAAGDDREQIVPAAAHAAGNACRSARATGCRHRLFDIARLVDVAGDAEQLGAGVVRAADAGEPGRAAAQDGRRDGDRLRRC